MHETTKGTVLFYGIPAYGHTLSNLYLAGRLAEAGFRVVYYSAGPFRKVIRENGCEYRPYPMDWRELDLRDGERILKLYRLILQYTDQMLPDLLRQARQERPRAILFESLALWGRAVGQLLGLPSFSFYSIAAIDWTWGWQEEKRPWPGSRERVLGRGRRSWPGSRGRVLGGSGGLSDSGKRELETGWKRGHQKGKGCTGSRTVRLSVSPWEKGLGAYAPGFSAGFLRYVGELPGTMSYVRRLRGKYGLQRLGLLQVLMNRGDYNLCGYSRLFQPGGHLFGGTYRFVGPLSVHRRAVEHNDFTWPEASGGAVRVYISLGTIFNRNERLLQEVIRQFGDPGGGKGTRDCSKERDSGKVSFQVVLVWEGERQFPRNFIVRPFVDQSAVLGQADLFITAGGVNSIHEALYFGVPCLLCPQQGEQLVNARQFERLGFGRILRDPARLRQEALECMTLQKDWKEKRRAAMTAVSLREVLELFERFGK